MLKFSKCGSHDSKTKSWILYRLTSTHILKTFLSTKDGWNFLSFITFQRQCVIIICKACWRLQSVGRIQERSMPKQSLCIFKVVIFNRNLTIIILIRTRSSEYKCRLQNSRFFFSKSVNRGVCVLRARSSQASHACRMCEARGKNSVSPQSLSLFSASFQTFCLNALVYLNMQKYGLFCILI